MKKLVLSSIALVILLTGCSKIGKEENNIEGKEEYQYLDSIKIAEIKNKLLGGNWLVIDILDVNGNRSEITRIDLFGSMYRYLDGIQFNNDNTFTNNIGFSGHGEESGFKGNYIIQNDTVTLNYDSGKTEIYNIIEKNEDEIYLTIKNLFNYSKEDYIVYYGKFDSIEEYNGEEIGSGENNLKDNSIEKIYDDVFTNNNTQISKGDFNLPRYLDNLNYEDKLTDCSYEISLDGKTIKYKSVYYSNPHEYTYTTNLDVKVKSFAVGGSSYTPYFLVLTEDGELYLQDSTSDLWLEINDFKLFGSGYDGICTLNYSRGDAEFTPFVARQTEIIDEAKDIYFDNTFNDYTLFIDSENKIVFSDQRP